MWKGVVMPVDTKYLTEAVTNNTLICIIDGSYNPKKAPDICSADWIIYCTTEKKRYISATLIE